jgi:hypothetical protein
MFPALKDCAASWPAITAAAWMSSLVSMSGLADVRRTQAIGRDSEGWGPRDQSEIEDGAPRGKLKLAVDTIVFGSLAFLVHHRPACSCSGREFGVGEIEGHTSILPSTRARRPCSALARAALYGRDAFRVVRLARDVRPTSRVRQRVKPRGC